MVLYLRILEKVFTRVQKLDRPGTTESLFYEFSNVVDVRNCQVQRNIAISESVDESIALAEERKHFA